MRAGTRFMDEGPTRKNAIVGEGVGSPSRHCRDADNGKAFPERCAERLFSHCRNDTESGGFRPRLAIKSELIQALGRAELCWFDTNRGYAFSDDNPNAKTA